LPLLRSDVDAVVSEKREGAGGKPEEFYELLESVSAGPRIELFSRLARKGWDRWKGG